MRYLDKRIATISSNNENKEKVKKSWEEQLEDIIHDIPLSPIIIGNREFEMKQISLFDDILHIYIPKKFEKMSADHIKQKYPHEKRPETIFHNKQDTINIGFSIFERGEDSKELSDFRDYMKKVFLSASPSSTIFDSSDFNIEEKQISYFTFNSHASGGQMFNLVFITFAGSSDSKIVMCNLNCLLKELDNLKPLFYGIMKTIEIKNATTNIQEATELDTTESVEPDEPVIERLLFDKDKLLVLPIIVTMPFGNLDVFICENKDGETPINNMYALDKDGEIAWVVFCSESNIDHINDIPFIGMDSRGSGNIIFGITDYKGEYGYYISPRKGNIMSMMPMSIRNEPT